MKEKRAGKLAACFFIALAAGYVWFHAGTLDLTRLWTDEMLTANAAATGCPYKAGMYAAANDPSGIVYSKIAAVAVKVAGFSETSLRFPALIFGALCVPMLFFILRRIAPVGLAILAPIVLFFSPSLLFASMTARGYSLFVLLALVVLYVTLRVAEDGLSKCRAAALFAAVVSAILISSQFWLLILGGALIVLMWNKTAGVAARYAAVAFFAVAAAVVVRLIFPGSEAAQPAPPSDIGAWRLLLMVYAASIGGFTAANAALATAALPLFVHGLYHTIRLLRASFAPVFIWFGCALIAAIVFSGAASSSFQQAIPLVVLLAVFSCVIVAASPYYFAVNTFGRDLAGVYSITMFIRISVTGFILLASILFYVGYTAKCVSETHFRTRENWREPLAVIAAESLPGDVIIVKSDDLPALSYLMKPGELEKLIVMPVGSPEEATVALEKHPRAWMLARDRTIKGIETGRDADWRVRSRYGKRYGGILGDILLFNFEGYFIASSSVFYLTSDGASDNIAEVEAIALSCSMEPEEDCSFSVFMPAKDDYALSLSAPGAETEHSVYLSFCGESRLMTVAPGEAAALAGEFMPGLCEITVSGIPSAPAALRVEISKKEPM